MEEKNKAAAESGKAKPAKHLDQTFHKSLFDKSKDSTKVPQPNAAVRQHGETEKQETKEKPVEKTEKISLKAAKPASAIPKTINKKEIIPTTKTHQSNIMVFGKYPTSSVIVSDIGLSQYMKLETKIIPHTFGKNQNQAFKKKNVSIVERLVNKTMRSGQGKRKLSGKFIRGRGGTGKKIQAIKITQKAFEIIEKQLKQNPIQVLVKAIENSAPNEDTTRIKRGGIMYSVAVDVSPLRRIDEALKNIALASFQASFNTKMSAGEALAKEIILASKNDNASYAVKRKDEIERIAKASR